MLPDGATWVTNGKSVRTVVVKIVTLPYGSVNRTEIGTLAWLAATGEVAVIEYVGLVVLRSTTVEPPWNRPEPLVSRAIWIGSPAAAGKLSLSVPVNVKNTPDELLLATPLAANVAVGGCTSMLKLLV